MVSIIPTLDDTKEDIVYTPTPAEQKTARRVHPRIQQMLQAREPYLHGYTAVHRTQTSISSRTRQTRPFTSTRNFA